MGDGMKPILTAVTAVVAAFVFVAVASWTAATMVAEFVNGMFRFMESL